MELGQNLSSFLSQATERKSEEGKVDLIWVIFPRWLLEFM